MVEIPGQLPLWEEGDPRLFADENVRLVILDPGTDQEQRFAIGPQDTFLARSADDERVIVEIRESGRDCD
jgi:hypothetical protein